MQIGKLQPLALSQSPRFFGSSGATLFSPFSLHERGTNRRSARRHQSSSTRGICAAARELARRSEGLGGSERRNPKIGSEPMAILLPPLAFPLSHFLLVRHLRRGQASRPPPAPTCPLPFHDLLPRRASHGAPPHRLAGVTRGRPFQMGPRRVRHPSPRRRAGRLRASGDAQADGGHGDGWHV